MLQILLLQKIKIKKRNLKFSKNKLSMEKALSGMLLKILRGHTGPGSVWWEGIDSFRVTALDCTVFKVWRNTKPVSPVTERGVRGEKSSFQEW